MLHISPNYPVGRPWNTADRATLTRWSDGASARLEWDDGKWIVEWYDTDHEALEFLRSMGFEERWEA